MANMQNSIGLDQPGCLFRVGLLADWVFVYVRFGVRLTQLYIVGKVKAAGKFLINGFGVD